MKTIKLSDSARAISVERSPRRVVITVFGLVVAQSDDALVLTEESYRPVHYIPRKDVDMSLLSRTEHETSSPGKGDCAYYSIPAGGDRSVNAVWTYEEPLPGFEAIKEYLAFHPDRVDAVESLTRS